MVALIYETIFAPSAFRSSIDVDPSELRTADQLDAALLPAIVPVLEQALRSAEREVEEAVGVRSGATLLHELPLPVCIVSRDLRLLSATRTALELLRSDTVLVLKDEVVRAASAAQQSKLERGVAAAIDGQQARALGNPGEGDPLPTALIAPIEWSDGQSAAALFLDLDLGLFQRLSSYLVESYDLTRSEAEVTTLLARGQSIDEIAATKGTRVATVRTQLKRAFAKTGTNRQGELVSLVLNGPALWLRLIQDRGRPTTARDESSSASAIELADGRRLSYGDYGPSDGRAVFVFHHLLGSRYEAPTDESILDRVNVRLIVPERPGVGASSPAVRRRLIDTAEDVRALADHLEIERFDALGFSSGGPHAAACASALRGRVRSLALVASLMPFDELPPDTPTALAERFAVGMARHWPSGIQRMLTLRYKRLLRDPQAALSSIRRDGNAADAELLLDPEIRDVRLRALEGAAGGAAARCGDELVRLFQPWGFSLGEIEAPISIWHGRQDEFFPASHAERMAALIPGCHIDCRDEWGHFFLYREWERVLGWLANTAHAPDR